MHDGERTGSRLDLPNTGDPTPPGPTSRRDTSGVDTGYSTRNTSCLCRTSPDLESILKIFGCQVVICEFGVNLVTNLAWT